MPPLSPSDDLASALVEVDRRAQLAQWFLKGYLVLLAVSFVSSVLQLLLLQDAQNGAFVSEARATANDTRELVVAVLTIAGLLANAVVFLRWKWAGYRLMPSLTGHPTEHKPGWAAGAYFVPILNLFRPYQIMREMAEESTSSSEALRLDTEDRTGSLIGVWWGAWVVSGIAERLIMRLTLSASTLDEFITLTQVNIGIVLLSAVAGVSAVLVIHRVNERQQRKGEEVRAGVVDDPLATLVL
ncbi:MAG: DUF4328 domain-containing protein [Rhodothermaceae bacterium]|nr:DUF4328 domain-containing protein [Rhodothermaceae bacterium]